MSIDREILEYLKELHSWARPKDIIEAIYPKFENVYGKSDFKRIVFRFLRKNPKIMKNFHRPLYAYKTSRRRLTKNEIESIRKFFEMVDQPHRFYTPNLKAVNQYPDIPLEKTLAFQNLRFVLSKLWKDPRDEKIIEVSFKH